MRVHGKFTIFSHKLRVVNFYVLANGLSFWLTFLLILFQRGYPLSTYVKFSEKLTFLTPWYAHICARIRGLEMLVFREILRTYLMDGLKWDLRSSFLSITIPRIFSSVTFSVVVSSKENSGNGSLKLRVIY